MSLLARCCCRAVHLAARLRRLPKGLDPALARLAISAIGFYQRHGSARTGRTCLFEPSCSRRAVAALRTSGFQAGMKEASAQLLRCGGNYALCRTCGGDLILIAADGRQFADGELSPALKTGRR